jgi:hypothetical protein
VKKGPQASRNKIDLLFNNHYESYVNLNRLFLHVRSGEGGVCAKFGGSETRRLRERERYLCRLLLRSVIEQDEHFFPFFPAAGSSGERGARDAHRPPASVLLFLYCPLARSRSVLACPLTLFLFFLLPFTAAFYARARTHNLPWLGGPSFQQRGRPRKE